jgi:alkanesulfonate monooxygenase SsuD/methylene tetrahydromethanopterin reductase-like flavin-dependent oxidoreductase (luciferase family)
MDIGIGLPNVIPGAEGRMLVAWARRAEERGFSTLATLDRIVYPSYESLIALAAAAAVTERIGLLTNILLGPTRNPILLAKEAASVDQISGGRLTLGLAVGARANDFEAAQQPFTTRGRRFDQALDLMHRAWRGEPVAGGSKAVTPPPVREQRVPILIGGTADAAIARTVRWGIGWTSGGGGPDRAGAFAAQVRNAWQEAGRPGTPRIVALNYYALGSGPDVERGGYLRDYYGEAPWVDQIVQWLPRTPEALREMVKRFADAGVDELIFDPTIADLAQVDLLADAVLVGG